MKNIPVIIFLVIIVTVGIISIVSFCDLDLKNSKIKNNYAKYIPKQDIKNDSHDLSSDSIANLDSEKPLKSDEKDKFFKKDDKKSSDSTSTESTKIALNKSESENKRDIIEKKGTAELFKIEIKDVKNDEKQANEKLDISIVIKDAPFLAETQFKDNVKTDVNFHSLGEYVSKEEYEYRLSLIKELKIKTIVIDSLKKGNGIPEEYFYIAYSKKMIPSKVLSDIVGSEEFRKLIPEKYLSNDIKTKGLDKGDSVVIKNKDLKNLLILWSLGRLSPVEKAVAVGAYK